MSNKPTKRADYVKPGDTCVSVFAKSPMTGTVLSVSDRLSIPQAKVKWASGSIGTHTITTLRKAIP